MTPPRNLLRKFRPSLKGRVYSELANCGVSNNPPLEGGSKNRSVAEIFWGGVRRGAGMIDGFRHRIAIPDDFNIPKTKHAITLGFQEAGSLFVVDGDFVRAVLA